MGNNEERRQYTRFSLDSGAFAVIDNKPNILGHILDISTNGVSFLYAGGGLEINRTMELGILLYTHDLYLDSLPARIVSEVEVKNDSLFDFVVLMRYGLQFNHLDRERQVEVIELIKKFSDRVV